MRWGGGGKGPDSDQLERGVHHVFLGMLRRDGVGHCRCGSTEEPRFSRYVYLMCCTLVVPPEIWDMPGLGFEIESGAGRPPSLMMMVQRKRMRTTWLLGACVIYSFSLPGAPAFVMLRPGFITPHQQADSGGAAAVARRAEISMSMKQKRARKKAAGVRGRRVGPRTDVEGYSHANFREFGHI